MIREIGNKSLSLVILLSCCLALVTHGFSQSYKKEEKEVIAINAGAGVLTFDGDIGSSSLVGAYSYIRSGYSFSIEKFFNKNFAASLNLLKGKIARDEKASDNIPKLNFESPIMQLGLNGTFLVTGKNASSIIPFVSAGVSFIQFDPYGDLRDKNGNTYYYWKDGSIRDLPETGLNFFYAQNIDRDYKYETKLTDSAFNYSRRTFLLPLTAGVKMKLSPRVDVNLGFTYHWAFSDYLDNVKSSVNDRYLFSSVSFTWHILTLPDEDKEKFSNIDFASIDNSDADEDGILDARDFCPDTPKDVQVDVKGCPTDSDGDGVPDYMDKEPHSKSGLPVDVDGIALTKKRMMEMQTPNNMEASERMDILSQQFNRNPSAEFMKQVEGMKKENRKSHESEKSTIAIPDDIRVADWDKDGFISFDEIAKTIDSFFDGSITFSTEQINRLVDFFFEQ